MTTPNVIGPRWEWGDRLRKIRRTVANLSQADMAALIGVKTPTYASWEGGYAEPSLRAAQEVAQRIEQAYPDAVSAAWLLGFGTDNPPAGTDPGASAPPDGLEPSTVRLHVPMLADALDVLDASPYPPVPQSKSCEIPATFLPDSCVSGRYVSEYQSRHTYGKQSRGVSPLVIRTWGGLSA